MACVSSAWALWPIFPAARRTPIAASTTPRLRADCRGGSAPEPALDELERAGAAKHEDAEPHQNKRDQQARPPAYRRPQRRVVHQPERGEAPQAGHGREGEAEQGDGAATVDRHHRRPDTERVAGIADRRGGYAQDLSECV